MVHETDLPCADCGADLVERDVGMARRVDPDTGELTITVAECPECGARYVPEQTLGLIDTRREPDSSHVGQ